MNQPLEGILVLDFTNLLPGPLCTLELARRGARVVKIERVGAGDALRSLPPVTQSGNALFSFLNRGKESVQIDLKTDAGREVALRLIERADVLVESFRPGTMARLGLGPDSARALNPRLVYASLSSYGADNPQPGHDVNFVSVAGLLGLFPNRDASPLPVQFGDILGGKDAAARIVMALFERGRSGRGGYLDLSLTDSVRDLVSPTIVEFAASRESGARFGRRRPLTGQFPCYNIYPTRDGRRVALGALEPQFWAAFCGHFELPRWRARQFDDSDSFRLEVAEFFRARDFSEWVEISKTTAFCLTPVYEIEDLPLDTGPSLEPAPEAGRHTAVVLSQLGYSAEAIDGMFQAGSVSGPIPPR